MGQLQHTNVILKYLITNIKYRQVLGFYLLIHFLELSYDSFITFSSYGLIKDTTLLPTYGKIPCILHYIDDIVFTHIFMMTLVLAAFMFMVGRNIQWSAAYLLYGHICMFNRNIFISNPSLAYIGWLLITFIVDPESKSRVLYHGSWVIAGLSYTVSGIHKLQAPSWVDGTALYHVFTGYLSRHNWFTSVLLNLPPIYLQYMTWSSLIMEISFLFLGIFKRMRKFYWFFFLSLHIGILLTVNFTDLTLGMIVSHLYLYDTYWPEEVRQKTMELLDTVDILSTASYESSVSYYKKTDGDTTLTGMISSKPTEQHPAKINLARNRFINFCVTRFAAIFTLLTSTIIGWYVWKNPHLLYRFSDVMMNAKWGFGVLIVGLFTIMFLERLYPSQQLSYVPGWWLYVLLINVFQLFAVVLATVTWEKWLQQTDYFTSNTGFHLRDHVSPFVGGFIAYLTNQWLFYWWHYLRHQVYAFWIVFHQFHHSPTRIEAITSFYKHPLEIIIDSQIMAVLLYAVLGLTAESSIWLSIFSGFGEYFYHMNIDTPQIIGYLFQRPESHRCHHRKNKRIHCPNYSDIVIWDILNDTFENPSEMNEPTGFPDNEEERIDMLMFTDVLRKFTPTVKDLKTILYYIVVFWGLFSSTVFLMHSNYAYQTSALVSSPLPLVFTSYNQAETFSMTYEFQLNHDNTTMMLTQEMYDKIQGSYAKRNVYGAMFAYGPLFTNDKLIKLRDHILYNMICDRLLLKDIMNVTNVNSVEIYTKSKRSDDNRIWYMNINC